MPKFPLHPSRLLSASRNASHQKSVTWKTFLSPLQGSEGDPRDSLYTTLLSAQQVDWPRRTWVLTKGRRVQAFVVWFLHSGDFLEPRWWLKDDPDAHVFTEPRGESGTFSEENRASFLYPDWHLIRMGYLKAAHVGGERVSWQQVKETDLGKKESLQK